MDLDSDGFRAVSRLMLWTRSRSACEIVSGLTDRLGTLS